MNEDMDLELIRDIEEKVRCLRESKSQRVRERWSLGDAKTASKPVYNDTTRLRHVHRPSTTNNSVATNKITQLLRKNDLAHVGPEEDINLNPQHLVSIIRPMIMEYVKSYLKEFKNNWFLEIKHEMKKMIKHNHVEVEHQRISDLEELRASIVDY